MPKTINWETTEVSFYKFVCKNPDILFSYVGHTVSFRHRKFSHKSRCSNPNNKDYTMPLYKCVRENGGFDNWDMIEIHTQICKNKRDAERIETELMEQQQFKLNVQRAYVTEEQAAIKQAEYKNKNREILNIKSSIYYEANKDIISNKSKEKYIINRDAINTKASIYRETNRDSIRSTNKKYCEANRDSINAKSADYYATNRDSILAKQRAKRALLKAQLNCELLDATNP